MFLFLQTSRHIFFALTAILAVPKSRSMYNLRKFATVRRKLPQLRNRKIRNVRECLQTLCSAGRKPGLHSTRQKTHDFPFFFFSFFAIHFLSSDTFMVNPAASERGLHSSSMSLMGTLDINELKCLLRKGLLVHYHIYRKYWDRK